MSDETRLQTVENGRDPGNGQFVQGNTGGPGRPPGSLDLMQICRRKAKETGKDLEQVVVAIMASMETEAIENGDVAAAKVVLERYCGAADKGNTLEVNVDARSVHIGPPVQTPKALMDQVRQMLDGIDVDDGES